MVSSQETRISALPAALQEKLRSRLAGRARQSDRIRPADRTGPLPLSFGQQRLWFLNELEPGAGGYNSALALRLTGSLDLAALTGALGALVARHESLRTTFDQADGKGIQVIHPDTGFDMHTADLTGAPPGTLD
ncbi:MAG TPA: condensation domain-containing protein, partial [Streptosporangiaceae bacterium]|nr:condensation domain-containing protein [Streptosporangiaceae bacterium]